MPKNNWPYSRHPVNGRDPLTGRRAYFYRHIYLYRSQLLYDIESEAQIIARARRDESGASENSMMDISDKYRGLINRWIDKYLNLAKGRMACFILDQFRTSKDNALRQEEEIDIELQVPEWWDDTVFQPLVQAVHDYIVNGSVYELLSLTLPPKENIINVKRLDVDESYDKIKSYICSAKPGRIKRPLQPF